MALRVWVVRHGDRFDFDVGDEKWGVVAQRRNDPPLSDLGNLQASEMAKALVSEGRPDRRVTSIISSPFLRCLETANPIAGATGLPIKVDHSLFEVVFTDEFMPFLTERAAYFPRIELHYESVFKPPNGEKFPEECLERYGRAAEQLVAKFKDESIVVVTHAAGVSAIVSALLKVPCKELSPVAPCSLFLLDRDSVDQEWRLSDKYNGTTDFYLSETGKTLPWPIPRGEDEWARSFLQAADSASWLPV